MDNVTLTVKGNVLTATVDLSKNCGPSKSGKSIKIGTTGGNKVVPEHTEMRIGLNVYQLNEPA